VDQAFNLLTPPVTHATAVQKPAPPRDPAWEKYSGVYTWKHSDIQILVLDNELTMIVPEAENLWESRVTLKPAGPQTFRMVYTTSTGPGGELLRFELDSAGRVTRASTMSNYWVRK
jgi:hypothetical protein